MRAKQVIYSHQQLDKNINNNKEHKHHIGFIFTNETSQKR